MGKKKGKKATKGKKKKRSYADSLYYSDSAFVNTMTVGKKKRESRETSSVAHDASIEIGGDGDTYEDDVPDVGQGVPSDEDGDMSSDGDGEDSSTTAYDRLMLSLIKGGHHAKTTRDSDGGDEDEDEDEDEDDEEEEEEEEEEDEEEGEEEDEQEGEEEEEKEKVAEVTLATASAAETDADGAAGKTAEVDDEDYEDERTGATAEDEEEESDEFAKRYVHMVLTAKDVEMLRSTASRPSYQPLATGDTEAAMSVAVAVPGTRSQSKCPTWPGQGQSSADKSLDDFRLEPRVRQRFEALHGSALLSDLEHSLLGPMLGYFDLHFSDRHHSNASAVRLAYALHVANHIRRSKRLIQQNNQALLRASQTRSGTVGAEPDARDQGFTRPRVLIVLPVRSAAASFVEDLLPLLAEEVHHKSRFSSEYHAEPDEEVAGKNSSRRRELPTDWKELFSGNSDDCFKIGISVTRKAVKLYSDFYDADIIVASPLGLRLVIGADADATDRTAADFLSSIEVVVVDHACALLMQNWDLALQVFKALNLQPKDSHGTDFSRVRVLNLEGHARYFRQTMLFSEFDSADLNAVFHRQCSNFQGRVRMRRPSFSGTICQVVPQIKQLFRRVSCDSPATMHTDRLEYFQEHVLPGLARAAKLGSGALESTSGTLVFVPSYLDFVRLRDVFNKKEIAVAACSEYIRTPDLSRHRAHFFNGRLRIMLYTERLHFYHRLHIRGVRHFVFYGLPQNAHFYAEMLNLVEAADGARVTTSTSVSLFTKFDALELERILGTERAVNVLASAKERHLFC